MSIKVLHLQKRFARYVAVDDVSFDVPQGELVGLLGPSGSGKSTLLRLIAGLEAADSGTVYLDGVAVDHLHPRERQVGFVFQHYALFRHMTVHDNIAFGLSVQGIKKGAQEERVRELLELVGLGGLEGRFPAQLSGGQRQRVALARALAPKPRLLLLDEPFGAVDAKVRTELRRWLRRLHDELHVTSLFVTHDQDEAFDVADRVVLMNHAKVEQVGTPRDVLEQPASEFVARFFGDVNIFAADIKQGHACVGPLRVSVADVLEGAQVSLVIRSYDVKLWRDDQGVAELKRITPLGDRVRIEADVRGAGPLLAHFPRRSSLLRGFELGCRLAVEVTFARAYPRSLADAIGH